MYHIDSDTWAYVDGHVGVHKWFDQRIITAGQEGAKGMGVAGFTGPNSGTDYNFVRMGLRFPGWR
jgi:hypothetical protein